MKTTLIQKMWHFFIKHPVLYKMWRGVNPTNFFCDSVVLVVIKSICYRTRANRLKNVRNMTGCMKKFRRKVLFEGTNRLNEKLPARVNSFLVFFHFWWRFFIVTVNGTNNEQ